MATDIALRSQELDDGYGKGYRAGPAAPVSVRYLVTKTVTDLGTGYARITLRVTCNTNNGNIGGGFYLDLTLTVAGVSKTLRWKESSANWAANTSRYLDISVEIPMNDSASRSAELKVTGNAAGAFEFNSTGQGGTTIDGIMLLAGIVWVGNGSSAPKRGEVYVGNGSSVPVKAKEVWVGNASSVPVKAKA